MIRKVIWGQKLLIWALVLNIASLVLVGTVHAGFMFVYLGSGIVACVGIAKLKGQVLTAGQVWVYCTGVVIPAPGLNLLVMAIVSSMTTTYLESHNVPVGLFGGKFPD